MKHYKDIVVQEVSVISCDRCGDQAKKGDYSFSEFISVEHSCGYESIHGDGNQLNIDLCQKCFATICGESLIITEPEGWDNFFQQKDMVSDDFMSEREKITEKKGAASGILSNIKADKCDDDESLQSSINKEN